MNTPSNPEKHPGLEALLASIKPGSTHDVDPESGTPLARTDLLHPEYRITPQDTVPPVQVDPGHTASDGLGKVIPLRRSDKPTQ